MRTRPQTPPISYCCTASFRLSGADRFATPNLHRFSGEADCQGCGSIRPPLTPRLSSFAAIFISRGVDTDAGLLVLVTVTPGLPPGNWPAVHGFDRAPVRNAKASKCSLALSPHTWALRHRCVHSSLESALVRHTRRGLNPAPPSSPRRTIVPPRSDHLESHVDHWLTRPALPSLQLPRSRIENPGLWLIADLTLSLERPMQCNLNGNSLSPEMHAHRPGYR